MADEDMRLGMCLSSIFDIYKFLLSIRGKIVGLELLHHVRPA